MLVSRMPHPCNVRGTECLDLRYCLGDLLDPPELLLKVWDLSVVMLVNRREHCKGEPTMDLES